MNYLVDPWPVALDTTKHFLKRWSSKAGRYFCDCGKAFATVTELERHVLEAKSQA